MGKYFVYKDNTIEGLKELSDEDVRRSIREGWEIRKTVPAPSDVGCDMEGEDTDLHGNERLWHCGNEATIRVTYVDGSRMNVCDPHAEELEEAGKLVEGELWTI